jgi:dipeptidyl-peptidase-4
MAVLRRPDAFRAAVAGAPVSRWEAYGCHYAERYLGDPIANRAGYEASALTPLVAEMRSDARLMIAHGMADENVHFRHSALLVDALRQAGKVAGRDYVLLPFPAERHIPKYLDDRAFLERRMFDFLEMNAGRRPPGGRAAGAEGGREAGEEEEADAEVRAPERGGESSAA